MDNQKNLLLAIVISMAIIFGFQLLIPQPERTMPETENTQSNGTVDLDTLLKSRDDIATNIRNIIEKASDEWGITVESVELKDIRLPDDLKRTMAKEAEAEREKRAVLIKAGAEREAAQNLKEAAAMLAESPGALHLRTLQSINDLSSDQSNTTIWMVPVEILRGMEKIADSFKR